MTIVPWIQAFATLLLGLAGLRIARAQMAIASTKLMHDLYEKRFSVFEDTKNYLFSLTTENDVNLASLNYLKIIINARFLFDSELVEYLEGLPTIGFEIVRASFAPNQSTSEDESIQQETLSNLRYRAAAELGETLVSRFRPYLSLQYRAPESLCLNVRPVWRKSLNQFSRLLKKIGPTFGESR